MAIRYFPDEVLKRMAPRRKIERLVTQRLTLNRAALASLSDTGILTKKTLEKVALKVIRSYKAREDAGEEITDKKLMVQRVQNSAVREISNEIKEQYYGEFYRWLPSDANVPDPLHQLNYGKRFRVGVGEQPGDRWGCQCGMEILTEDDKLEL